MNKQLINKYKNEFDHWLNGGKLLCYTEVDGPYYEVTDEKWDFVCGIVFILNDEYVEFRKALAEDKIIQVNNSNPEVWVDIDINKLTHYNSAFLRIKPDESKFKAGDFVRYIHSTTAKALEINNINGNRYYFTNSEMSCLEHELEPWTPVKDEWCWFYDNKSSKSAVVGQFKEACNDEFISTTGTHWNLCEPFLNSRPSYLKDK